MTKKKEFRYPELSNIAKISSKEEERKERR